MELERFRDSAEAAARAAGDVLAQWAGRFAVREKARADLVTEADLAAQATILDRLRGEYPDHGFLGEENADLAAGADGYRWVVDPLDGTTNYVHGLANYAVSIALEHRGQTVAGVVFDPVADECFSAVAGGGARLNGHPLCPSGCRSLSQALVAMSFPAHCDRTHPAVLEFLEVLAEAQSTRRLGSASLNLSYIAAGRLDAYWASNTKIWDVAAGLLVVRESGAVAAGYDGGTIDLARPRFVAAATSELAAELRGVLARVSAAASASGA